ncbi:MAG: flagellar motor switch protein FliN [Clostridia bacterium]|nr:flagellar motor switch protein FliN [Clostridia bacterium]
MTKRSEAEARAPEAEPAEAEAQAGRAGDRAAAPEPVAAPARGSVKATRGAQGSLELVMDLPLEVTVELGRTTQRVRDILELGPGAVVELDRMAGEPVDVLVNGRLVARGEVVVIDESFGVRIAEVVPPAERVVRPV